MIAFTNAFKQGLVGTYSATDTVFELDSISDVQGDPDYLADPSVFGGYPIIIYDSLFGNPADSNNAGDYEILTVTGINYTDNEITVGRGAENTTAQVISGGDWVAVFGLTSAMINSLPQPYTNGSPATMDEGVDGQRKVDLYNFYEHIGVWLRYPKDMSQEPDYILESIDEGLVINDLVGTYKILKANQ